MSLRRVSKSAVDWAAFAKKVPPGHEGHFSNLKAKTDAYVSRIFSLPDKLPSIDFTTYSKRIKSDQGKKIVELAKQQYASITVAYPRDSKGLLSRVETEEKEELAKSEKFCQTLQTDFIDRAKLYMASVDKLPPLEEFTLEIQAEYFPGTLPITQTREFPQLAPYGDEDAQPGPQMIDMHKKPPFDWDDEAGGH
jgi:hypothetical protein